MIVRRINPRDMLVRESAGKRSSPFWNCGIQRGDNTQKCCQHPIESAIQKGRYRQSHNTNNKGSSSLLRDRSDINAIQTFF